MTCGAPQLGRTDRARSTGWRLGHEPPGADEGEDTFVYDPAEPVITTGGDILVSSEFRAGPLDQSRVEARPDVLVYSTDPLEEDVEVTVLPRLLALIGQDLAGAHHVDHRERAEPLLVRLLFAAEQVDDAISPG